MWRTASRSGPNAETSGGVPPKIAGTRVLVPSMTRDEPAHLAGEFCIMASQPVLADDGGDRDRGHQSIDRDGDPFV